MKSKYCQIPDKYRIKIPILSVLVLLVFWILTGCQNRPLHKEKRLSMGTFIEVISPDRKASQIVFSEIARIEKLLSKYLPDSDISQLNSKGSVKASPETWYCLKKAKEFWLESNGAFDVTVGPLLDIWGFTDKNYRKPDQAQIRNTLQYVGMNKVVFDDARGTIALSPGARIDLGGLGKGYALDCAIKKLKEAGIKNVLINAGGQIQCLGDKIGEAWDIAVENPLINRRYWQTLQLKDKAVATSGNYEQYFIKENVRYGHIMNPKTGYPVSSGLTSVTVIAPDGITADCLSTSIFALGRDKGMELAKKFSGVEVRIIE